SYSDLGFVTNAYPVTYTVSLTDADGSPLQVNDVSGQTININTALQPSYNAESERWVITDTQWDQLSLLPLGNYRIIISYEFGNGEKISGSTTVGLSNLPLFSIAEDGFTVVCPYAEVGSTGVVNGVNYTKRNSAQLRSLVSSRSFDEVERTCTSGITDMERMFYKASAFNRDISSWDVSSVTNMRVMFYKASAFNRDISSWDVSSVTDMSRMFFRASAFNNADQPLNWGSKTANVRNTYRMFIGSGFRGKTLATAKAGAGLTLSGVEDWDMSSVTDMAGMFDGAPFDADISGWDLRSVTAFDDIRVAGDTLWFDAEGEIVENDPLLFDEGELTFRVLTADTLVAGFLRNTEISTENVDALLVSMSEQSLQPTVTSITTFPSQYSDAGAAALEQLSTQSGVQISTGGQRTPIAFSLGYEPGWNLVSTPMQLASRTPRGLFPSSNAQTLNAFEEGEYSLREELTNGWGYWLYFDQPSTPLFDGFVHTLLRLHLQQGWNLIGSATHTVALDSVEDPGQILKPGSLFGWSMGYQPVSSLQPGRGYWVYAEQAGIITLPSQAVAARGLTASLLQTDTAQFSRVILSAEGFHLERFFEGPASLTIAENSHPLPPAPPAGLDARWEDGSWLQGQREGTLLVSGIPAEGAHMRLLAPQGSLNRTYQVEVVSSTGPARSFMMVPGQAFTLDPSTTQVHVSAQVSEALVFRVEQNFPNPFNPATTIRYALPERTNVRLEVYSAIGQRVAVLVNGEQNAGWHVVNFNASHLASGVYFYRLRAGRDLKTFKMTLIK
ncbi:MAG: BspA family leucine-rich repeat surface protein, partial [Anaerolineales bacterium]